MLSGYEHGLGGLREDEMNVRNWAGYFENVFSEKVWSAMIFTN